MSKELQVANPLIKKYKKYVSNLEWHIKTNKPEGEALRRCEDKLECFKEVLHDLNELPSPSHSEGRWVRVDWVDDSDSTTQLIIERLEVNCFDEDSEMSIRVGQSQYQSLTVGEVKRLTNFLLSHIKNETDANPESPSPSKENTQ